MHEWGLVAAAVHRLTAAVDGPVTALDLKIAPTVDAEVARAAFAAAADGTVLSGAEVRIVPLQATLACLDCTRRYPGRQADACPGCGGTGLIVDRPPEVQLTVAAPASTA